MAISVLPNYTILKYDKKSQIRYQNGSHDTNQSVQKQDM